MHIRFMAELDTSSVILPDPAVFRFDGLQALMLMVGAVVAFTISVMLSNRNKRKLSTLAFVIACVQLVATFAFSVIFSAKEGAWYEEVVKLTGNHFEVADLRDARLRAAVSAGDVTTLAVPIANTGRSRTVEIGLDGRVLTILDDTLTSTPPPAETVTVPLELMQEICANSFKSYDLTLDKFCTDGVYMPKS